MSVCSSARNLTLCFLRRGLGDGHPVFWIWIHSIRVGPVYAPGGGGMLDILILSAANASLQSVQVNNQLGILSEACMSEMVEKLTIGGGLARS